MILRVLRLTVVFVSVALSGCVSAPRSQTTSTEPPAPELPSGYHEKKLAVASEYMVAAAHPLAVEAGLDILARGGSATDAAIAVQLVLNLVEPQSSGIGGGAFLLHYDALRKITTGYDGRESAPMAVTADLFIGADGQPLRFQQAVIGGRSVGVPGVLRAAEAAHSKHGKLPWATLFEPAIALADGGFALSPRAHTLIANDIGLRHEPTSRSYFFQSDGTPKSVGTILKNPQFAEVLRRIAKEGPDAPQHLGPSR